MRARTFPNALAGGLLVASLTLGACERGALITMGNALVAFAICFALFAMELVWRRALGRIGIGMGDIKFLFGVSLHGWLEAILSFAGGLLVLGTVALVSHRESLPLLPFVAPTLVVLVLAV